MAAERRSTIPELSIVVVNYNVRDFLHHALVSLRKASRGLRTELIVVDNASDDGSADLVRRRFPGVRLVANKTNLGFARGNNIGLRFAHGEFVLFINPDTVVQEDTIRTMLGFMRTHPDAGLTGCKILNPDGTLQLACRRSFPTPWVAFTKVTGLSSLFPRSRLFGRYNLTYLDPDETSIVDAVSGAFMMVRREVLQKVGGLDERFFMYGEDLDWCYRIRQAGWKIYYVHSTKIIHYKGESTRRSGIDEARTFYDAMHRFVSKHYGPSGLTAGLLRLSIFFVSLAAWLGSLVRPLRMAAVDAAVVILSLVLAEFTWRGGVFLYPSYAYPAVYIVPALLVVLQMSLAGVYTFRRMSVTRTIMATAMAFLTIAALTAFVKTYAFSRMIMVISGFLCMVLIPGWRILLRWKFRLTAAGRGSVFGKRTLIVGTTRAAQELLHRLRVRPAKGYEVIGFIDLTHRRIGEDLNGVPILGTLDNVGKVVRDFRASDLIVAPEALSYTQVLTMVARLQSDTVSVHLVPSTMEVLVGKASVDHLDELPLVQISYNIDRLSNRLSKRLFDAGLAALLLMLIYPIFFLRSVLKGRAMPAFFRSLPLALSGRRSLVGPPEGAVRLFVRPADTPDVYLGKPGLTGLVQLQRGRNLAPDEIDQYNLYYARNQSVVLDLEILLKSWLQSANRQ